LIISTKVADRAGKLDRSTMTRKEGEFSFLRQHQVPVRLRNSWVDLADPFVHLSKLKVKEMSRSA